MIGAFGFHRNIKQPDSVVFYSSLYEIDRMIEEKTGTAEKIEESLEKLIPNLYHPWLDAFSK